MTSPTCVSTRASRARSAAPGAPLHQAVDAEKKVMIGFRLGDLWTDTFTYSKGKRAGEQG
jgi:hypothetical protein